MAMYRYMCLINGNCHLVVIEQEEKRKCVGSASKKVPGPPELIPRPPSCALYWPPKFKDTPPGTKYTPGLNTPPHPEADCAIRSTSGRYASYWNAFLLLFLSGQSKLYLGQLNLSVTSPDGWPTNFSKLNDIPDSWCRNCINIQSCKQKFWSALVLCSR